jgi:hypothetical protein
VIAPSTAIRGEDFSFVVIAQDEYRNPVADYRGTVSVYWNNTTTPASHHLFSEADQGHYRFSLSSLPAAGFHFLRVSDGTHTAYSNIIEVLDQPPGYRLFWETCMPIPNSQMGSSGSRMFIVLCAMWRIWISAQWRTISEVRGILQLPRF